MKIEISKIPPEGLTLDEEINVEGLDAGFSQAKFNSPFSAHYQVSKITNSVTIDAEVEALISYACSRCLEEFSQAIHPKFRFNYPVDKSIVYVDPSDCIREEIVLSLPIKSLCSKDCKGLCVRCGANLNQGQCKCQMKT